METDIIIKNTVTGILSNNVYLLINRKTNESFIVDPSYHPEVLIDMIKESGTVLKAIFLTHGHFDHVLSVEDIRKEFNVPVYAGKEEKELLSDKNINMSARMREKAVSLDADEYVSDGEIINVADIPVKCIYTPGHTKGSVCFYVEKAGMLLAGDTLFCGSHGRTDFPTGDQGQMENSLKEILFKLPDDTEVLPGHGEKTSIGYEKKHNMINFE